MSVGRGVRLGHEVDVGAAVRVNVGASVGRGVCVGVRVTVGRIVFVGTDVDDGIADAVGGCEGVVVGARVEVEDGTGVPVTEAV